MMRYFVYFSYRGTAYCGWQKQPNAPTVEETMETAFTTILREPIELVGAGRTDAGVHASLMVAHFDSSSAIPIDTLAARLNHLLPHDIAILKIVPVRAEAHARFDATTRTYTYHISQTKSPFLHGLIAEIGYSLDFVKMNAAAQLLLGEQDFKSFCRAHTDVKTTLCTITRAEWSQSTTGWVFTITANRFLRNMVRAIVGTLLEVGRGRMSIETFQQVIHAHDRKAAGQSAPAEGLYLTDITYPIEIFL